MGIQGGQQSGFKGTHLEVSDGVAGDRYYIVEVDRLYYNHKKTVGH